MSGDKGDDTISKNSDTNLYEIGVSDLKFGYPLFLHPNDTSPTPLNNFKLTSTDNYNMWSCAMKFALRNKSKLGFIDEIVKRKSNDPVLANQWDLCNSMVFTWILNSISAELYAGQIYSKTAFDMWTDLKDTYNKVDGSFDAMISLPVYTVEATKHYENHANQIKLMQFLMGLDDVYQPIRSNILTREPLPLVKIAFVVISGKESHRNVTSMGNASKAPSVTAFAAKAWNSKSSKYTVNNVVSDPSPSTIPVVSLSNEQMLKLLSLIDDKFVSNSVANIADVNISIGWVVDSGAIQHMTASAKFLINVVDVSNIGLTVGHPNSTKAKIVKIGDLKLNDHVTLFNVLVHNRLGHLADQVLQLLKDDLKFDHNKIPSSILAGQSPYSLVYGRNPTLSHLRAYGCLCFATILNNNDKFNSRSKKCVFIGYSKPNPKRPNDEGRVPSNDDGINSSSPSKNDVESGETSIEENAHLKGNSENLNHSFKSESFENNGEEIEPSDHIDYNDVVEIIRKSSRLSKLPTNLNDYVIDSKVKFRLNKVTVVANSTTEAEYVVVVKYSGYKINCWITGQMATGKELSNLLMAGSLSKTTLLTTLKERESEPQELRENSELRDRKRVVIKNRKSDKTIVKIKTISDDVRLQALIDGKKVVIIEASIRHDLKLNDAEGTSCLSNVVIFRELARIGYEKPSEKLTSYKAFFSPQWKFLIHTILQCISAKTTSWNEFSSTMASAIICLSNNKKFNFSKESTSLDGSKGEDRMKLKELMDLCTNLSNKVLDLKNEVIEMKSSHKAKIKELESMVEKLEKENMSLTKELKSFNTRVESLTIKETIVDKEESSKQGRKIADIDADAEVNLENVYNLDMAHEETVLSMQDVLDTNVKEVVEEMVEVMEIAKIIVNEVSTAGGELNVANEKPVSVAPTNITTAQPSKATKTTVDITTAPKAKGIVFHDKDKKAQIALDEDILRRIEAEWNADMKYNIDWNEVVEQVQSKQSDAIRPIFEVEYNKVQAYLNKGLETDAEMIKVLRKRTRKEQVKKDQPAKKKKGDQLEQDIAKKQKLKEQKEAEELKRIWRQSYDVKDINEYRSLFSNKISEDGALVMVKDATSKEIKDALFDIGDNKASGPDRYSSMFFKKAWKDDLLVPFHSDPVLVKVVRDSIEEFGKCSGLLPNFSKSPIFFGSVSDEI
nr:hypothetical protein [Tanacetum cinerariifolium]